MNYILIIINLIIFTCIDIEGQIYISKNLKQELRKNVFRGNIVYLNNGTYKSNVLINGKFFIYNVEEGFYVLTIFSKNIKYSKIFLEVTEKNINAYRENPETKNKIRISYPLKISPGENIKYFEIRQDFDFSSILRSPMGIILSITVVLMLCMNAMPDMEELKKAENPGNNDN